MCYVSSPGAPNVLTPAPFHPPESCYKVAAGRALPTWPLGGGSATWRPAWRTAGSRALGSLGGCGVGGVRIWTPTRLGPGPHGGALSGALITVDREWVPLHLCLSHPLAGCGEVPTPRVPGPLWTLRLHLFPPGPPSLKGLLPAGPPQAAPPGSQPPRSAARPDPLGFNP